MNYRTKIKRKVDRLTRTLEPVHRQFILWEIIDKLHLKGTGEEFAQNLQYAEEIISESMNVKHYVWDSKIDSYVFVPPVSTDDGWRIGHTVGETYYTQLPVEYICSHLDNFYREALNRNSNPERSERIRQALDSGVHPLSFSPIYLQYHQPDRFTFSDGIHRLQVFSERRIPCINARLSLEPTA